MAMESLRSIINFKVLWLMEKLSLLWTYLQLGDLQELEETENSENADWQHKNLGKLFVIFVALMLLALANNSSFTPLFSCP